MTSINDLSEDLVEEILSRVPMTSLGAIRSTCKLWNAVSKDSSFKLCGKAAKNIMLITMRDFKPCLMSVNLHKHQDFAVPFIKQIGKFKKVDIGIYNLFYCNGLLLCGTYDNDFGLVVWNPYTGQTRRIQPRNISSKSSIDVHGLGYDSNNHHKILRISYLYPSVGYEIYDFKTNSWSVLDVSFDWRVCGDQGVSLKGNNYFITRSVVREAAFRNCLLCFDFTKERFWSVPLPCNSRSEDSVILSVVREEKLAVLYRRRDALEMEIWITNRIDGPNVVSWSCFLKVDKLPINRFEYLLRGSFFVDEKKKVAVIFRIDLTTDDNYKACMVGEGGHYREVNLGETFKYNADMRNNELDSADKRILQRSTGSFICSSYVPSSVQIQ